MLLRCYFSPVRTSTERTIGTLTTTEAAVLALLALEGERSGYDLLKRVSAAVAHVWRPAKSQLYAVLPRLVDRGLASRREVAQETRPNKHVYRISDDGRGALARWLETVETGATDTFFLKLFVGSLTSDEVLVEHVAQFRADTQARLDALLRIEPTNTRQGADAYHWHLLRLGIERNRHLLTWADEVLDELRA